MRERLACRSAPIDDRMESPDVAMHLHCAHTHRMLQAMCTQCATKRGGLENVVGRTPSSLSQGCQGDLQVGEAGT